MKQKTQILCNTSYIADSIEQKLVKVQATGEPIGNDVPLIYQDRGEGVLPAYDIRTDKMQLMQDAIDQYNGVRSEMYHAGITNEMYKSGKITEPTQAKNAEN